MDKQNIPNIYNTHYLTISGLYASQGYAVVLPYYIGYGRLAKIIHPYVLFPKSAVKNMFESIADAKSNHLDSQMF